MKNKIDRMKTPAMHLSKRTVALILSVIMLVSSIATGSMLNTFAAYIKDNAAKTDAIADAASEGSAIAESAIPSEDADAPAQADDADEKPDLSGFEESPIVRKMKQDLADTGAKADLASTSGNWDATGKNNLKISFDGGNNWHTYNSNSDGYITFTVPYNCTAQWEYWADYSGSKKYLKGSGDGTPSSNNTTATSYWARYVDAITGETEYSANLTAGEYVIRFDSFDTYGSTAGGSLKYYWHRKVAKAKGDITGGWNTLNEMSYDEYADAYYYEFTGGGDKYFRFQKGDNGWNYLQATSNNKDITSNTSKSNACSDIQTGDSNAFKLANTTSGKTYRVWLAKDFGSVWWTNPEDLSTTDYYFGDSGNGWGATHSDANKFTRNQDGTYTFQKSLNNDYQFCIRSAGGTMFRMTATNAWEVKAAHVNSGSAYNMVSNSDGHNLAWQAGSNDVIITFNPNTPSIKFDTAADSYYLTGWLNGGKSGSSYSKDDNLKFTETATSGVYTYAFTATGDEGGYQYVTITDSSNETYHPASHGSGTGTAGTSHSSGTYGDDNKWQVTAKSGQTVTFTWDTRGSDPILSWTVSGSATKTGWLYSGTAPASRTDVDPTAGFTSNSSNYFVYGDNDGLSSNAVPSKKSGTQYWIDCSGKYTPGTNFFIGISNHNTKSSLYGNSSTYTNDSGTDEKEIKDTAGKTLFKIQRRENSGRYFILIYGIDGSKVTNIGIVADIGSCTSGNQQAGAVQYKVYYKGVGSSEDTATMTVYAKDGAAPINWDNKTSGGASATSGTAYNYAAIATTTITQIDDAAPASGVVSSVACGDESSKYQVATVDAGKSITVKTTIASDYRSKYYVVGWCINGVTYKTNGTPGVNEASDTSTSNGECTLTYTLPAEPTVDYLEITPIYYLRDTTGTITFYLEGYNTVVEKWGNTPYIYPFYGNLNNVSNSFGVYPGQPMVYAEGKYSTQIPLTDIPIIGDSTNTPIKGITINNGYADHVHRNMIYKWSDHDNDADHKQTYDYDDFYKIYEECLTNAAGQAAGNPNSIIFRIIDETNTYNRYTYGGTNSGARVLSSESSLDSTDLTNINDGNGWEVLRNRYDQPIDLFGNVVTEPSSPTAVGDNVRVVSTGYNANIAGDYGTAWKVYKKNGSTGYSLIQDATNGRYAAPPSIFLLRGNESGYSTTITYPEANRSVTGVGSYTDSIAKYEGIYKAAYADTSVKGKPVYITYEKDAQDTRDNAAGTGAYRLDGRWYYTHSNDTVKSTVGIEYFDKTQNKWLPDTVSESTGDGTSGGTNKNNVQFASDSYESASKVTTSKDAVINENKILNFTATAGTGYLFEGWYIKYSDTSYDKIEGAAEAASIKATANYELIARFVPIVTGSLTIDHKLTGSSTGEGTVDMQVLVKDGNTTKATYNGSHIYIDGTYISNTYADYTIDVTLKTTPKYDGTVTAFGYDKFNTSKSITATTTPETLPGSEGALTTSHFSFTVGQLYAGTTLSTSELTYYSTIAETPHYYNFTYNFNDRSGSEKSYTAKGEILLKEYKQYVGDNHSLDGSYVKAKAPFESNFLKKNTLNPGTATYSDHTFTATSNFAETVDLPVYTVRFKLPYDYYTDKSDDYKKYTAIEGTYNADKATFDLAARYDQFVTTDASVTTPGTSTSVSKSTEPNHTDNDFITAPDQVGNMYFAYWSIKRLADTAAEQAAAPEVARIYYPDFHYRIYGDYYVEAVFSDKAADSWHNTYSDTNDSGCSILYVGDSRNQWNNGSGNTSASESVAADKIYSDFIFNYRSDGAELKGSDKVKVGMIIERVVDNSSGTKKWAVGSADVSDMSYYEKQNYGSGYDATSVKADILAKLGDADSLSSATKRSGCVYVDWSTSDLNNKNNLEENYSVYSAYGQTVGDHSIEFTTNNAIDTYVYRAYAVMKYDSDDDGTPDKWCISDPAYFCMRYTANLKYSE